MTLKLEQDFPRSDSDHSFPSNFDNSAALEAATIVSVLPDSSEKTTSLTASPNAKLLRDFHGATTPLILFHDGSGVLTQCSRIRDFGRTLFLFLRTPTSSTLNRVSFSSLQRTVSVYPSATSLAETASLILEHEKASWGR